MQVIVVKDKKHFRKADLQDLKDINAIFYHNVSLGQIKELRNNQPKIFAVQPNSLVRKFESLPWNKLSKINHLKYLVLATTSYNWIDIGNLKKQGVKVINCPGKATSSVAEGYVHALLTLSRKVPLLIDNGWNSNFDNLRGREVANMKIGIVGLGEIGGRFADILSNYGCDVFYWNRKRKNTDYKYLPIAKLFKEVDCIFLSFATNQHLTGFISQELICSMKKDAYVLSCIDHEAYDEDFIIKRVQNNKLGGFAFESDELKTKNILGNIWIVPDSYYYFTEKTRKEESRIFTESIVAACRGEVINEVI